MPLDDPQTVFALGVLLTAAVAMVFVGARRNFGKAVHGKGQELLHMSDAASFPITGSVVLFSLYVLLKFIPREYINWLLSVYLTVMAVFALGTFLKPITGSSIAVGLATTAFGVWYFWTKHWILNNLLAVAISVVGIETVQLSSFKVSTVLLVGLFFYDIFWVFGTDVMVTVATGIEGPIKILFPQTILGDHTKKSLLGLGDIVIPGFFVAQTFVFSALAVKRGAFYLYVAMAAYACSLINTMVVLVVFSHAQPALLYIVPWLLVSVFGAAIVRGDALAMWNYDASDGSIAPSAAQASASQQHGAADEKEKGLGEVLWELVLDHFGQLPPEQSDDATHTLAATAVSTKKSPAGVAEQKKAAALSPKDVGTPKKAAKAETASPRGDSKKAATGSPLAKKTK